MFEGCKTIRIESGEAELAVTLGGKGPPVLLLHGYPQTRVAWAAVAARLIHRFTVVIPDLPGYGMSKGPTPEATNYSKRHMAQIMKGLVGKLGYDRVFVVGHDRGGRVGFRLALDHPDLVRGYAPIDILPSLDACEAMDWKGALRNYHWPLLAQPSPLPERLIGGDPDFFIDHLLARWAGDRAALDPRAVDDYVRCFRQPSVIAATCADYRAGMGIDLEHDRADRDAGRRIACPVRIIWGRRYLSGVSPLDVWRRWASDVSEVALDCGHFVAEEKSADCAEALEAFFSQSS